MDHGRLNRSRYALSAVAQMGIQAGVDAWLAAVRALLGGALMQWFRMYAEFATDPKVQSMSETFQRRFVMFLCLHCNGEYERLSDEELAFALRLTLEELQETRQLFIAKGFIQADGKIKNWDKRQYISDNSYDRVKRHRERRKAAGLPQQCFIPKSVREQVFARDEHKCRACGSTADLTIDHIVSELQGGSNEPENLQTLCRVCNASKRDHDNETFQKRRGNAPRLREQIQKEKHGQTAFDRFWLTYPRKKKRKTAREIWVRKKLDASADLLIADVVRRKSSDRRWIDGFIPDPTTYLNGERWQDEIEAPHAERKVVV